MVISEDPWHSHLLPSVWQWISHYLFLRLTSVKTGDRTLICCIQGTLHQISNPDGHKSLIMSHHEDESENSRCMTAVESCLEIQPCFNLKPINNNWWHFLITVRESYRTTTKSTTCLYITILNTSSCHMSCEICNWLSKGKKKEVPCLRCCQ